MANKDKNRTDQLFEFAQDSYFERTSRPVYAIVFLLPFIIFYELGTILINTDVLNQSQVRVVAFVWLRGFLEYLGFGSKLSWVAPPLAVIVILVSIQLVSRKQWRFWVVDIAPMAVECILLAIPLIVLTLFLNSPAGMQGDVSWFDGSGAVIQTEAVPSCSVAAVDSLSAGGGGSESMLADIVTGIGAGIYEELIFRLILISVLMILFQDILRFDQKRSVIFAVLISAAMFSAHHHIIFFNGQFAPTAPFNWTEFIFRTIAGIYFSALFAVRGFGITAGTHAFYDIIAVFINAYFFGQ
ncbi:MAG: CPBP family intramembrane glutamic endopeptidase [Planctomycetota bacterium]|jgi:membrane protease YdiL (CAAX protease family)